MNCVRARVDLRSSGGCGGGGGVGCRGDGVDTVAVEGNIKGVGTSGRSLSTVN